MRYANQIIRKHDRQFKQISKTESRKLFAEGKEINLHPCNMNLYSGWSSFCPIVLSPEDIASNIELNNIRAQNNWQNEYTRSITPSQQFDERVSNYEIYNCIAELGKYANYFIEVNPSGEIR